MFYHTVLTGAAQCLVTYIFKRYKPYVTAPAADSNVCIFFPYQRIRNKILLHITPVLQQLTRHFDGPNF